MYRSKDGNTISEDLNKALEALEHLVQEELPEKAEEKMEEFIYENFEKEAYTAKGKTKWEGRKKKDKNEDKAGKRKLLIGPGGGDGRRSIEVDRKGASVGVGTDSEYMPVHNEGLKAGRGAGFTMPKRQHMPTPEEGVPDKVEQDLKTLQEQKINKIFKR